MCRLARSLKSADCRYLRYLYREESAHCAISPGEEGSALELLEALERACVVSSERPERVGEVMRELGREDCYHEVESFAQKHQDEIQRLHLSHTQQLSEPVADLQRDSPLNIRRPIRASDDPDDDNYCQFITPAQAQSVPQPIRGPPLESRSLPPTSSPDSSSSTSSSSEQSLDSRREWLEGEEGIYDYPYAWPILQSMHSKPKPLLEQKMRLLVNPLRHMLTTRRYQMVASAAMKHATSSSTFILRIDPAGYNRSCISAYVNLLENSQLQSGLVLQAELTVTQPQKSKGKRSRATSSACIHQSSVLMDMPAKLRSGRPSVVARFPYVIGHRNLLSEAVVTAPFLELKLVLREHLPAS